jgi:hypothetical protein
LECIIYTVYEYLWNSFSFQPNHEKLEAKVNELKKAQMEAKNRARGLSSDHGTPKDASRPS